MGFFDSSSNAFSNLGNSVGDYLKSRADQEEIELKKKGMQELLSKFQKGDPQPANDYAPPPQPMADLGMGMSDTINPMAQSNQLEADKQDMTALVEGKKDFAKKLLSNPEEYLNLIVEAEKAGVSTDAKSLLDRIGKIIEDESKDAREEAKIKAQNEKLAKQESNRMSIANTIVQSKERIAKMFDDTRDEGIRSNAEAIRYRTDNAKGGSGGRQMPRLESLTLDQLHALSDGLSEDIQQLEKPSAKDYDSYDKVDQGWAQIAMDSYRDARDKINQSLRDVDNQIKIRSAPAGGSAPKGSGSPQGSAPKPPVGASGRPSANASDQEIAGWLQANKKQVTPQIIMEVRRRLQGQ